VDLNSDAFGPLVIRRSRRRTAIVIAVAILLYVGFLIARLENSDQKNGLLALQVIPIALVALELGVLPGLVMAAAAMGSVAVWSLADDIHVSAGEYVARGAVYFPIAIAVGWAAGRLRTTESLLENREQRPATIVESSTDALVTMDSDGRILAWNPVAEHMFGWTSEEALGKDLAQLTMPPRIAELYTEGKRRFLEEGDWTMIGRRFESRALTRDGREFPIEIAISAVRESQRWIFHVFGHDITERKASQEERNRLASIVDSTGDAILSFTLDGRITSWNPGAERIYGYSQSEALQMTLFDFVPPDRPDDVGPLLERMRRGERTLNVDYDGVGKYGRRVEVAVTATPIENAAGRIVAGAAIHRDVSDRKRRERHVSSQHAATRLLAQVPELEEVGPAILPLIAEAGSWMCGAYWRGNGEGLRCDAVWSAPALRPPVRPIQEGAVSTAADVPAEARWLTGGDAPGRLPSAEQAALGGLRTQLWLPIEVSGELFGGFQFFDRRERERDDELIGTFAAIAAQIGDYVRRRRAEEAVERSKDEFFGLVSHELRTPLTSIIGYGELLFESEAERLTDEGRRYLDVIRRNAQREMRLVGDLLLLVRIQEGTFRIEPETVDLRRIVEQAVEAARPAADKRDIELTAEVNSTLTFEGDPQRLGQVVDNLLSNAIKFTPRGGEVSVRLSSGDRLAAIEVTDTGTGIPADQQEYLFDRLYRAPSAAASAVPGVGLGLTIVKAIVDAHHGRVAVESEPGVGATFRVELPVDGRRPEVEEAPE
jgi:two-component system, OmpR family, phosphate regulon sensor histidine kinase PhoR